MEDEAIRLARIELRRIDPALAVADQLAPAFSWRHGVCGFEGLARIIVSQQLSTSSAAAIWKRVQEGLGDVSAESLLRQSPEALKGFGLSSQKAKYLIAIAEFSVSDAIGFSGLGALSDEEAVALLTKIKGVGRWTAEAYLMNCEGRMDLLPAGDLGLQEALRLAEGGERRLTEKELYLRAENWRPYRGVAAHLLWAYYSARKQAGAKS